MDFKTSIIDQTLEGLAEKIEFAASFELQSWNECSVLSFWGTPTILWKFISFRNLKMKIKPFFANFWCKIWEKQD